MLAAYNKEILNLSQMNSRVQFRKLRNWDFAVDGSSPLEAILPSPFICVYVAIFATILAVLLWHMDSAPALKCNG